MHSLLSPSSSSRWFVVVSIRRRCRSPPTVAQLFIIIIVSQSHHNHVSDKSIHCAISLGFTFLEPSRLILSIGVFIISSRNLHHNQARRETFFSNVSLQFTTSNLRSVCQFDFLFPDLCRQQPKASTKHTSSSDINLKTFSDSSPGMSSTIATSFAVVYRARLPLIVFVIVC